MTFVLQQVDLSNRDFERIQRAVYDHCGINLTSEKRELVRARLSKMLRHHQLSSYEEYLDQVLAEPSGAGFTIFIDRLSTNLTSFFREQRHFEYLQNSLIPRLLHEAAGTHRIRLRGWSAACSSGEEPYSLAMTLLEALPNAQRIDLKILASDISTAVLRKASEGRYPVERLAQVPPVLQKKYFTPVRDSSGPGLLANQELRNMLLFKQLNLTKEWPITTPLDFIFCRNVLIYFDQPTRQRLITRFHRILKPGGVLFIGHSESLSSIQHKFKSVSPAIYAKKGNA